jgi:hypothetical protein
LKCICGEHLLFAIGEAAEHCLYVRQINDSFAFFWQLTADGLDEDAVVMRAKEEFDAPEELLRADYRRLLCELVSMGYLIPGEEAEA